MWALIAVALAVCPDVEREIEQATSSLALLDLEGAERDLESALEGLGCGPVATGDQLGRLWLAEGILASLNGDARRADGRFAAAKRHVETPDLSPYGDTVAAAFSRAEDPGGRARLQIEPELKRVWTVYLDGVAVELPVAATAGLHVVQIEGENRSHLAKMLWMTGDTVVIEHDLPEVPPKPARDPVELTGRLLVSVGGQVLVGNRYETAVDGESLEEPLVKVLAPIGMGFHLDIGRGWGRVTGHIAPLLFGDFIFAGTSVPQSARWAWGLDFGGGASVGKTQFGVLVGGRLPSRLLVRGVASFSLSQDLRLEPTLGFALPTSRGIEPTAGLDLQYRFRL